MRQSYRLQVLKDDVRFSKRSKQYSMLDRFNGTEGILRRFDFFFASLKSLHPAALHFTTNTCHLFLLDFPHSNIWYQFPFTSALFLCNTEINMHWWAVYLLILKVQTPAGNIKGGCILHKDGKVKQKVKYHICSFSENQSPKLYSDLWPHYLESSWDFLFRFSAK